MNPTIIFPNNKKNVARPWIFWLLFFFQFAAIGAYYTYLNVYYKNAGMTGTQIGVLNMATALVGVSGSMLWGYVSDQTGKTRHLIAVGAIGSLLVAQIIPLVHTFWAFLGLGVASSLLNSAPGTLVDSTTITMLSGRREDYGRFRVGGSIGYILSTLSSGYIFDLLGLEWMFPVYGIIMMLFAGTALLMPNVVVGKQVEQLNNKSSIIDLIKLPVWILFTVCVFLAWIASNASIMFLGVSLNAIGANQTLIGLAVTVGAIAELPFMAFSSFFMRRFGDQRLITIALILMTTRFFLLGIMKVPEYALAINILNGPAFAFYWNSAVTFANRMAPLGYTGTAQGMLNSTMSLAGVTSSLLIGWLFDKVGATELFLVMSVICLASLLIFTTGNYYLAKKTRDY